MPRPRKITAEPGTGHIRTPDRPAMETPTLHVLLDPGHGGFDAGTAWEDEDGTVYMEKDIAMRVVDRIVKFIPPHVRLHISRTKDEFINARNRAITPYHLDLIVSVHVGAAEKARGESNLTCGTAVYVHSLKDPGLVKLAEAFAYPVAKALGIDVHPGAIRSDPKIRLLTLAEQILDRYGRSPSIIRPAPANVDFGQANAGVPAVVIDLGYLTNAADRAALVDPLKQNAAAKAIAEVIAKLAPPPHSNLAKRYRALPPDPVTDDDLDENKD